MKLEYNIVGVAKNSEEDLRTIYDSMAAGVFGLALSVTRSRKLAREIAVETFRRVVRYAVTFDTDMSGQYWILDICMQLSRNSLRDPAVSASTIAKQEVDNASALLRDALFNLGGDRGTMLSLKALTELKNVDIAQLCGYYTGSAGAEIRRGIARLADMDETREKKEILRELKKDVKAICPDFYDRIGGEERTVVAHVSHEAMYLPEEVNSFSAEGNEEENVEEREEQRKKRAKGRRIRVLAIIAGVLLLGAIVAGIVISTRQRSKEQGPTIPPGVQFGNTINMVSAGGKLFYRGVDGGIFSYDPDKNESSKVYDGTVRELITDGEKLYFRGEKSKIYSIAPDGSGLKQLCGMSGTTLCLSGGSLYFSASDGIYSMPASGVADDNELTPVYVEEVEDAPSRYCIVVDNGGKVFFSGGADKGIYGVSEFAGSAVLNLYYFDEVYYMTLWGDRILFDAVSTEGIELFMLDPESKKLTVVGLKYTAGEDGEVTTTGTPVLSYSAAYCSSGNKLWYEGYVSDEAGGKSKIGIYVIEMDSDEPRLVLEIPADGLHISEMFAEGSRLYCYYSDGKSDGERRLVSYNINDFEDNTVIFDWRRQSAG